MALTFLFSPFCSLIFFIVQVARVRPQDKDAKVKLAECQKVVQMLLFQKAIAVDDDKRSVADSINLDSMSKYFLLLMCLCITQVVYHLLCGGHFS